MNQARRICPTREGAFALGALWTASLLLVGCDQLVLPAGPDLDALGKAYASPQGGLDEVTLESVVDAARQRRAAIAALGDLDFVVDTLESVGSTLQKFGEVTHADGPKLDIASTTNSICPGYSRLSADDPGNGEVNFTVTVDDSSLTPVVWGHLTSCKNLSDDREQVVIDADLDVLLQGDLDLYHLQVHSYIFRLDGKVKTLADDLILANDFRVFTDRSIEVRVPSGPGDVVFRFGTNARRAAVRAKDRAFCCDFDAHRCVHVGSANCDQAAVGDQELSW
jgi:hypothetical protein